MNRRLYFNNKRDDLDISDFTLEELDFTQFDFRCFEDKENYIIAVKDASFRDIFNFTDFLFFDYDSKYYSILSHGTTLIYHKEKDNIFIDLVEQDKVRGFDNKINPLYGLDIDKFNINSGNYFVSIRCPGGFYCYQLDGNPYRQYEI